MERYREVQDLPAKVLSRSQIVRPRIQVCFFFYIMLLMRIKLSGEVSNSDGK